MNGMVDEARHFRLLDGLRGLAAMAVFAFHFSTRADLDWLMPRGYLAVDFFFVLSGFVLAFAYGQRLREGLSFCGFIGRRLVRLLPMLAPGTVFGALIEFGRPGAGSGLWHALELGGLAVLGCLIVPWPWPTSLEHTLFPINGPIWSILMEMLANCVFVVVARRAFPLVAAGLLAGAGAIGVVVASHVFHTTNAGALLYDWAGGVPRVMYSFFVGVLVFAVRDRLPGAPAWVFPCVLLGLMALPGTSGAGAVTVDLCIILAVFPLMVGSASQAAIGSRWHGVCAFAGDVSYPFYAIHYPIVRAACFIMNRHHLTAPARLAVGVLLLGGIVLASWGLLQLYDQPVRRYLTRRLYRGGAAVTRRQPARFCG